MANLPTWPYFVGDIHGCWDSYRALEDKIGRHAARAGACPLVVSVGDLVDRGPASDRVVAHFRTRAAEGGHAAVLGNHDLLFLEALRLFGPEPFEWPPHLLGVEDVIEAGDKASRWLRPEDYRLYRKALWLSQGGYQTLTSYGADPKREASWRIDEADRAFLLGLPILWQDEAFVVSHALATPATLSLAQAHFYPEVGRAQAASLDLRLACDALVWSRETPAERPDPRRLHVSGHTPVGRPRRRPRLGYVQIDTACVYGGRLTALCGPTGEILSQARIDRVDF